MIVHTDDGRKIMLNDDGTWNEVKEQIEQSGDYDVRKVRWGMNQSEVKNTESLQIEDENVDLIAYKTRIAGFEAYLVYDFFKNELTSVRYIFLNEHSDDGDFIYDFEHLKDNLTKKYGKPNKDDRYFSDELYEDTFSEWGMSLGRGKLSFFTQWNVNDTTEILLSLYGDNYHINFSLRYSGLKYKDLLEEESESQLYDDL